MSTNAIYQAVLRCIAEHDVGIARECRVRHLDVGAGRGELIRAIRQQHQFDSMACDFHVERFGVEGIDCAELDLNCDDLPYRDATFDLVTCSEVVEHLENYRRLTREIFRVATPGGFAVVTTPNVLNAKSRIRYLCSGFANLFGPLPTRNDKRYSTGGHITPIPYFYLAHALLDAGFVDLELTTDKTQRTSVFWSLWVAPVAFLGRRIFVSRERRFDTITLENKAHVDAHFSWRVLLGRTIVVCAAKPKSV